MMLRIYSPSMPLRINLTSPPLFPDDAYKAHVHSDLSSDSLHPLRLCIDQSPTPARPHSPSRNPAPAGTPPTTTAARCHTRLSDPHPRRRTPSEACNADRSKVRKQLMGFTFNAFATIPNSTSSPRRS